MMIPGKMCVAMAATVIMVTIPAVPRAQGANSPEVQRLAAQRNQAAFQRLNAQRAATQRSAAGAYGVTRATGGSSYAAVSSARGAAVGGVRPTASSASLSGLGSAMSAFALDVGRLPTNAEGLGALLKAPPGVKNWRGPYISQVNWHPALTDPWGNQYRYNVQQAGRNQIATISSDGPDRTPGTADDLSVQF